MSDNYEPIAKAVTSGDQDDVMKLVNEALSKGASPVEILDRGLIPGIQAMGAKFESGDFFLPEILLSVRAMNKGAELVKPHLGNQDAMRQEGKVVLGTIEGDIHDIGKNLVKAMLESSGFEVIDIGVNMPAERFIDAAKEHKPNIIAISALLTTTMVNIPSVLVKMEEEKLRDRIAVLIGGACISREFADKIGVEGYAKDCVAAVSEAKRLIKVKGGN